MSGALPDSVPVAVPLSVSDETIFDIVVDFLSQYLDPSVTIVRGQLNRVAAPATDDYIVIIPGMRSILSTNRTRYDDNGQPTGGIKYSVQPTQVVLQIDVHGPNSADNAQRIVTVIRDSSSYDYFLSKTVGIVPLYCEDARQSPFTNESNQVEDRWSIDFNLQANSIVTLTQQFAGELIVTPKQADRELSDG